MEPDAVISQPLAVGDAIPVQRTSSDGFTRVGPAAFSGWLALALFGLVLAGAAVMLALLVARRTVPRAAWQACLWAIALALVAALTGAIAGAFA